ncbi:MAG: agmatinase [Spirochaetes bacterium]|nr:agmatinase [Spirochaetota bacterium]
MKFLDAKEDYKASRIILFGVPFDGTSSFRKGSAKAPDEIRASSDSIETYSPYLNKDLMDLDFYDAGDLKGLSREQSESMFDSVSEYMKKITSDGKIPFALGGEHLITYPVVKSLMNVYENITVVQFDAHTDLREDYDGVRYSHATVMKRLLEIDGVSLIQTGIRSGPKDEFELMNTNKTFYKLSDKELILKQIRNKNVYITVDIDVFDPSSVPGTGNPEAGGITFLQFIDFIKNIKDTSLIGCDVAELNPDLDPSGISSIFTAQVVRELLLIL